MALKFFSSAHYGSNPGKEFAPATARDERIYAIGDIHGRFDLLVDLLQRIASHAAALPSVRSAHVVLLGDMIDRGNQSAEVLNYVCKLQQKSDQLIVLPGNHEELMLRAVDGERGVLRAWLRAGGDATLKSFGIEIPAPDADVRDFANYMMSAIPRQLVPWLRQLPLTARSGDYLFCHAGIRPNVSLKRQTRADLLWIRDEFLLDDVTDHGAVIVHGHNVSDEVEVRPYRIGIDTGAYRSGVLTALYLEGTSRQIISANGVSELA